MVPDRPTNFAGAASRTAAQDPRERHGTKRKNRVTR
jgi:hypothetical protein